jgi:hypothetical protein
MVESLIILHTLYYILQSYCIYFYVESGVSVPIVSSPSAPVEEDDQEGIPNTILRVINNIRNYYGWFKEEETTRYIV